MASFGILYILLYPILLGWYYEELGYNIKTNYGVSVLSIVIPVVIIYIGLITMVLPIIFNQNVLINHLRGYMYNALLSQFIFGFIIIIIGLISLIALLYTFYAGIFGKINKFEIDVPKSLSLFISGIILFLIYFVIDLFILIIFLLPIILFGNFILLSIIVLLFIILLIIFEVPFFQIFMAEKFLDISK